MWVLIRTRKSGIVNNVERFVLKDKAIEYAADYWSDGTWSTEEKIRSDLDNDRHYEDSSFIISLHMVLIRN